MKKIFTLALAAAAVFSASAAQNHRSTTVSMNQCVLSNEVKTHPLSEISDEFASRAGEEVDITGTYAYGLYTIVVYGSNVVGRFIDSNIPSMGITIEKDAEGENRYTIKNFLWGFWNQGIEDENDIYPMNDLKATYDPATRVLSIDPYQLLFTLDTRDEKNNPVTVGMHMVGTTDKNFDKNAPIEFTWDYGVLAMTSNGFTLGEIEDDGENAGMVFGPGYQFGNVNCYIPNGTFAVETEQLGQMEFPILGVWKESPVVDANQNVIAYTKAYVINFSGFDMLRIVPMINAGDNRVLIDGKYGYTGWNLMYGPTINENLVYDDQYYAAQVDAKGYPEGTGFSLYGTIEESTDSRFVVSFPDYGLFTENDVLFGSAIWENGVLTFAPNAITGIETIDATVDNSNAPVVYYNLQGMRVNNPANGFYIRVQGNEATKIVK